MAEEEVNYTTVKNNLNTLGTNVASLIANRNDWKSSRDYWKDEHGKSQAALSTMTDNYNKEVAGRSSDLTNLNTKITEIKGSFVEVK